MCLQGYRSKQRQTWFGVSKTLSAANIGKILRHVGYTNWVDGSPLTPDLILQIYQYTPPTSGSGPKALNNSCYMLDIHDGLIGKYRYTEVHPSTQLNDSDKNNHNTNPGIFVIKPGAPGGQDGSWHVEAVTDENTRKHIQYNSHMKNHRTRDLDTETSGADRMIKSTVKVGQKRKSAGTNVTPVGTTQLLEEDHLDVQTDTPSHSDRFVYPEPTERSIEDGMILQVDGTDLTQFNQGGWWMDNVSDPARLTTEILPSKNDKDAKVHMVVVCVTRVDHCNPLRASCHPSQHH